MSEWEYYYLDLEDADHYATGLFRIHRADLSSENRIDESISLGRLILDFKDGELVGLEIFDGAENIIDSEWRNGSVDEPETLTMGEDPDSVSLIDKLKEKGVLRD